MVDEDINEPSSTDSGANEFKSGLEAIKEQLAAMNQQYQQGMQSIVESVTRPAIKEESEDDFLTTEEKRIKALERQIQELSSSVPKQTQEILRQERELNDVVFRLASQFPEITGDASVQQEILKEHSKLSKGLRDTAEGYELAVQRVVTRKGLVPKSKRNDDVDPDVSSSAKRGTTTTANTKRPKISEKTLAVAQLLGRDINDPDVLKRLEAAQQKNFNRYK